MAGGQLDPDDELACSTSNDHKLFTEVTTLLYFLHLDTTNDKTRLLVYKKMNITTHEQLSGKKKGTNRSNVGYNTEGEWRNVGRLQNLRRTGSQNGGFT